LAKPQHLLTRQDSSSLTESCRVRTPASDRPSDLSYPKIRFNRCRSSVYPSLLQSFCPVWNRKNGLPQNRVAVVTSWGSTPGCLSPTSRKGIDFLVASDTVLFASKAVFGPWRSQIGHSERMKAFVLRQFG
jgi:hypothetical protein